MGLNVSRPWLPEWGDYQEKLRKTWETGWLTHNGPLVREFEDKLSSLWGVRNVIAVSNGTIAIQLALRALEVKGEVITTPFTWKATCTAIVWEGLKPRFCDIEEKTLCLDPKHVEEEINERTGAILPVNVYGNPPDFVEFARISREHGIPIIYDGAHAANTVFEGDSCLSFGDVVATSFHATKLIHTAEGGACVTNNDELADKIRAMRFFGFSENLQETEIGTNGKMTELNAAMGLCVLDNLNSIESRRKEIEEIYDSQLGEKHKIMPVNFKSEKFQGNAIYYPILFQNEEELLECENRLNRGEIFPRRYFHPSLNITGNFSDEACPQSEGISKRILCLPMSPTMSINDAHRVLEVMFETL